MSTGQKSICIIDDDEIYLFAVKRAIQVNHLSERILEFHNGQEALDYFSAATINPAELPDVIFVDINMPVMNGWEFIDAFKRLSHSLPKPISVYVVSSSVNRDDIEKARKYSVADYLAKPLLSARVRDIVNTLPA